MITTANITSHEFIGLNTKIVESSNPQIVGLNGTVIDETKSMFTLNTENGIKSIAKANKVGNSQLEVLQQLSMVQIS